MNNKFKKQSLSSLLKEAGFILPMDEEAVEAYNKKLGNTNVPLPKEIDNTDFIFKSTKQESAKDDNHNAKVIPLKTAKNDFFKKLVLAAEIAWQLCNEPTFGHVKFVKIYFLCEEVCNMKLSTNYGRYAAGPLDPKQMYTVDAEFKKRKWFKITKRENGYGIKYEPAENVNEFKKYFIGYFQNEAEQINHLIELFRKQKTDYCEIVATIFSVWKKALSEKQIISNDLLISKFYDWGDKKKRFEQIKLVNAIKWMKENAIVPC